MKKFVALLIAFITVIALGQTAAFADKPLESVKGVYYGSNVFGSKNRIENIIELLRSTEVNTVIIDKKDDWGFEVTGDRFQKLIAPFRAEGATIMCRIVAIKDSVYAKTAKGSTLTLKSESSPGTSWKDRGGNTYLDPAREGTADYIAEVSVRALRDGCDSLNFDYIRLPSPRDGKMADTIYPSPPLKSASDINHPRNIAKRQAMQFFLERLVTSIRKEFPNSLLAASVFGYACYGFEPGVGQYLEDFVSHGFAISCMAYPTHYSCGDEASDPSWVPYKIYHKTIFRARAYLTAKGYPDAVYVTWLQGFTVPGNERCPFSVDKNGKPLIGNQVAEYENDPARFREQIRALNDHGIDSWLVWQSSARYRKDLFKPKPRP